MINQEFLHGAAHNLLLMTLLFFAFTLFSNWSKQQTDNPPLQALTGLIFGGFACLGLILSVTAAEGITLDAQVPIISMAGIFAGPIGAIFATLPVFTLRTYIGGAGLAAGIISILIPMIASGALGYYIKKYNRGIVPFKWIFIYSCIIAPLCLTSLALLPQQLTREILVNIGPYLIGTNFVGALLLGYMLSQDQNRRILVRELKVLRRKAEQAAEAKSVFMARMSHELRTPMNSIIGFSDLLRSTHMNDEQRYYLEQIKVAGRTMTALVSDILDFSKMDVDKTRLELAPLNLAKLIESCGALMLPEAREKNIELHVEIDPRCPEWVEGDELRLRQIFMNLLSNAVKFTEKGEVKLKAAFDSQEGDQYTLSFFVEDTGIGIPSNKQISIFNAFEQVDASLTRQHGGSGLGLAIAYHLASIMEGHIALTSVEDRGSTFRVTLTLKRTDPVWTGDSVAIESASETKEASILIVEDIAMNRELAGSMLTKLGYGHDFACNGAEAIEKIKSKHFDLVFMDLQMPVMNGYDATRAIRNTLKIDTDKLPIIALTAHALPEEIGKCFEAGMDDFLTKPVEFVELASKVEEWISGGTDGWDIQERSGSFYENVPLLAESELRSFISFVGNERLQEAYEDFVNDNAARLMLIRTQQDDTEIIRCTLHNMTATSGNLGMKKLSLYSQHLLNQGVARERPAEEAELDLLDDIFRESCRTFERYMSA